MEYSREIKGIGKSFVSYRLLLMEIQRSKKNKKLKDLNCTKHKKIFKKYLLTISSLINCKREFTDYVNSGGGIPLIENPLKEGNIEICNIKEKYNIKHFVTKLTTKGNKCAIKLMKIVENYLKLLISTSLKITLNRIIYILQFRV